MKPSAAEVELQTVATSSNSFESGSEAEAPGEGGGEKWDNFMLEFSRGSLTNENAKQALHALLKFLPDAPAIRLAGFNVSAAEFISVGIMPDGQELTVAKMLVVISAHEQAVRAGKTTPKETRLTPNVYNLQKYSKEKGQPLMYGDFVVLAFELRLPVIRFFNAFIQNDPRHTTKLAGITSANGKARYILAIIRKYFYLQESFMRGLSAEEILNPPRDERTIMLLFESAYNALVVQQKTLDDHHDNVKLVLDQHVGKSKTFCGAKINRQIGQLIEGTAKLVQENKEMLVESQLSALAIAVVHIDEEQVSIAKRVSTVENRVGVLEKGLEDLKTKTDKDRRKSQAFETDTRNKLSELALSKAGGGSSAAAATEAAATSTEGNDDTDTEEYHDCYSVSPNTYKEDQVRAVSRVFLAQTLILFSRNSYFPLTPSRSSTSVA